MITHRYKDYTIEVKTSYVIIRPDGVRKECSMDFNDVSQALEHAVDSVDIDIQGDEYDALNKKQ